MNKTDRLLAIVLKLQSGGQQRAEDLARFFETSKRTIYRDLQALSEAGVPLIAIPGQGYSLVEGYFLPPLSFSSEEAIMLLLGGEYVAQNFDARYQAGARAAMLKIEGVLPAQVREEVGRLRASIRFIATAPADDASSLKEIRRAVLENRSIAFRYHTRHKTEGATDLDERQADPYGLVYYDGSWYVVARDHARQDLRNFRLDRLENLRLLSQTFERPPDFKLSQRTSNEELYNSARVRFDTSVARWVKESRFFYMADYQDEADGSLLVTLQMRQERDVLGWLMSWGRHVQILEPDSLRQQLIEELQATLTDYKMLLP